MKEQYTIITGCNRGIGKATLEIFAQNGCNIIAVVRKADIEFKNYIAELSVDHKVNIEIVMADFADEDDVRRCAKEIMSKKVSINALINNVGIALPQQSFTMTKMEVIKEVFQVNFFSPLLFTQIVTRAMLKTGGSIVFVSSVSAYDGGGNVEYSSSKAAILGEVHRLALELGKYNIRVNAVAPGLTETDMANVMSDEDKRIALQMNIMQRLGKPEEIGNVIYFLASDKSSFLTGQVLRADGGIR